MQSESSRLRHDTPERQDFDDIVPDGMVDEANVDPDGDRPAEEEAVRQVTEETAEFGELEEVAEVDERVS